MVGALLVAIFVTLLSGVVDIAVSLLHNIFQRVHHVDLLRCILRVEQLEVSESLVQVGSSFCSI